MAAPRGATWAHRGQTCPRRRGDRITILFAALHESAFDAVDGASSAASKWYRMIASKPERFKEVMPGNEMAFEVFKELARTRRRNADTVDPGIGRTRLGQRTLKGVFLIGTRSAHSIRASGLTAAQTGRTHDRTRPMLQQRQKVLAKAPSTHDPKRTLLFALQMPAFGGKADMGRNYHCQFFFTQMLKMREIGCNYIEGSLY